MPNYRAYVCFSGAFAYDALKGRAKGDYETVKAAVLKDGGYSAFDASNTAQSARIFTRIDNDPELTRDTDSPFPWVGIRLAKREELSLEDSGIS